MVRRAVRAALYGLPQFLDAQGFELSEPEFPLVAVVFADRASYAEYAQGEVGTAAAR